MSGSMPLPKRLHQHLRRLQRSPYRDSAGETMLEGVRLVRDSIGRVAMSFAVVETGRKDALADLLAALDAAGVDVYDCGEREFATLSDTEHAQGILAVVRWSPGDAARVFAAEPGSVITMLHRIADPRNLGTIIRTCDWFGRPDVLLSRDSVDPSNPKVVRGTMGSLFNTRVSVYDSFADTVAAARAAGFRIIGTSGSAGEDLAGFVPATNILCIFGSEAHGIADEQARACDDILRIPRGAGARAESLNLAVAHGIVLGHFAGVRR
jgi:RNA methyltransferase, TrmH family